MGLDRLPGFVDDDDTIDKRPEAQHRDQPEQRLDRPERIGLLFGLPDATDSEHDRRDRGERGKDEREAGSQFGHGQWGRGGVGLGLGQVLHDIVVQAL